MGAVTYAYLFMTLLSVVLSVSDGQRIITAEAGQTVSLPCKALNNETVIVVDWRRIDPKPEEDVLLYRDERFDNVSRHPSYQNRVDLQDRQMKDGNVSLILKNVKTEDRGTYECSVVQRETTTTTIRLEVVPAGHTDGHKEDGGDKDGGDKQGGDKDGSVGLIAGLTVTGVLLIMAISFFTVRHMKKKSSPPSSSSSSSRPQSADQPLV